MDGLIDYVDSRIEKLDTALEEVPSHSKEHTRLSAKKTVYIHLRERFDNE